MFKLNSKKYADMIEAYKRMEALFEEEKQYLLGGIGQAADSMEGSAVSGWKTGYTDFFGHGAYADAMEHLKELRVSMEEMQPLVNRVVAEGLLLTDQLDVDEMIFPGSQEAAGEEWIQLDEAHVGAVKSGCVQVQETRESLEGTMAEIRELCGGIVDIGEEAAQFEEANKALKRVETFREAFEKYVYDVRILDEELGRGFAMLTDAAELEQGTKMAAVLCGLGGDLRTEELKKILEKDPLYWTEEETRTASGAWTTAVGERDTETIRLLLDACRDGESGRVDHHRMGVLREYTEGESREILSALMREEENLPDWTYAEYLIDVMEKDGCLTIVITQDVLLERDNSMTVTSDGEAVKWERCIRSTGSRPRYDGDYYKTAAEFLEKDGEGRYAFEILLGQDAGEVGEREKEILALLYQDKCRVVETAPSRESREGQFAVTERFVEGMFRYQMFGQDRQCAGNVYLDEGWRTSMLSHMEDDSSFAGRTLLMLNGYEKRNESGWRDIRSGSAPVHAVIAPHKAGLTLDLEFRQTDLRSEPEQASLYINSEDRVALYVKSLDPETLDHLAQMGYGRREIVDTYLLAGSVTDEDFLDHVMKAEYRDAFRADPEELGDKAKLMLPSFASKLCLITDENGKYTEWEQFMNDMLYQDEEYCVRNTDSYYVEDYVTLMAVQSGLLRRNVVSQIPDGKVSKEEVEWIGNMDIMWRALYQLYREGDILLSESQLADPWYSRGECLLQVSNLEIDPLNQIMLTLELCGLLQGEGGLENGSVLNWEKICTLPKWDPKRSRHAKDLQKIRDLDRQIDSLWAQQTIDTTISVMGIFYPNAAVGVKTVIAALVGNNSDVIKNITNAEILKQYKDEGVSGGIEGTLGMLKYYEGMEKLRNEKDEAVREAMMDWFYSADVYSTKSEGRVYLGENICDYTTLQKIRIWNEEGCVAFIQNENLGEDAQDIMAGRVYELTTPISDEQKEVLYFMIYGANDEEHKTPYESILDMDGQLFLEGIDMLDEIIGKVTRDVDDTLTYWREWENLGEEE